MTVQPAARPPLPLLGQQRGAVLVLGGTSGERLTVVERGPGAPRPFVSCRTACCTAGMGACGDAGAKEGRLVDESKGESEGSALGRHAAAAPYGVRVRDDVLVTAGSSNAALVATTLWIPPCFIHPFVHKAAR